MSARDLIAAGLYLIPAVVFAECARQHWLFRRRRRPRSRAFRLLPIVTAVLAAHYFLLVARALMPGRPLDPMAMIRTPAHILFEDPWLVAVALLRHLLKLLPLPEVRPSALWLFGNYGIAVATAAASMYLRLRPGSTPADQEIAHRIFEIGFTVLGGLCVVQFVRMARPGSWKPEWAGEMRRPDVVLVVSGVAAAVLAVPAVWLAGGEDLAIAAFEVLLGLAIAAPMVSRMLGHVVPGVVVTGTLVVATAGIVAGYTWGIARVESSYHAVLGLGAVLATLGLFTTGQRLLYAGATRVLLRRPLHEAQELHAFLQTLSPEAGVVECARRVLAELTRVRRLPGAAMLFSDGETIVHGDFDPTPLTRVWPRGEAAAALPRGPYGSSEIRDLPAVLRDAIREANVGLGVSAIDSPRRRWGHLFLHTGFLGGTVREDDIDAFQACVDQLALLFDAAALFARTVAVERSLAHAEKLAAIGELAARFAHDIRNPVTAARSLAQQLARDPLAPANAEHAGIILEELERVERQVRDLLRFARREELRLASVDLGMLARVTVERLRSRLDAAGVAVEIATGADGTVRGDRDKLDHVLVNVVENAIDAMAESATRRLVVAVEGKNGTVALRVSDSGPGVTPDALGRLFEPFYSGKASGTGLGLAIAKRTIDAHGGRIAAACEPAGGLTVTIELPAESAA